MTTDSQDVRSQEEERNAVVITTPVHATEGHQWHRQKKNYIALMIILTGFGVGSLFVDIVQIFAQRGFSARALRDAQVVEYNGDTWVKYDDPKIVVDVVDADDCDECMTDEVLVRLRSYIPTLEAHRIDMRTDEGRAYAQKRQIAYIPAFIFSKNVDQSDFYRQAAILFKERGKDAYFFDTSIVGIPVGEYISQPPTENGIVTGSATATMSVVAYDNLLSDNSRSMHAVLDKIISEEPDRVRVITKMVPQEGQPNVLYVAQSAICAAEQGAYDDFIQFVYTNHSKIATTDHPDKIVDEYVVRSSMDQERFHACVLEDRTTDRIMKNAEEASRFGVAISPTYFVDGKAIAGAVTYEELKEHMAQTADISSDTATD